MTHYDPAHMTTARRETPDHPVRTRGPDDPTADFRRDRIEQLKAEARADTECYQARQEARIKEAASLDWDIRATEGSQYSFLNIGLREIESDTWGAW